MSEGIRVNGQASRHIEVTESLSVAALLARHSIDAGTKFLAVAVNDSVVRRAQWAETLLRPGDRVEIVRPLQGG